MNEFNVVAPTVSTMQPSLFYSNLPDVATSFELTTINEPGYYPFYDSVYNEKNVGEP